VSVVKLSCLLGAVAALLSASPELAVADTVALDCVRTNIAANRQLNGMDDHYLFWIDRDKSFVTIKQYSTMASINFPIASNQITITPTQYSWNISNVGWWLINRTDGTAHQHLSGPDNMGTYLIDIDYQCSHSDAPSPTPY